VKAGLVGRACTPKNAAAILGSDTPSFVSGQIYGADGGASAG
jgi:hypothetical protein